MCERNATLAIAGVVMLLTATTAHAAIGVDYQTLAPASGFNFTTIDDPSAADGGTSATVAQHPNSSISATAGFNTYSSLNNGLTATGILHSSTTNDLLYYYDLGSSQNIQQINAYSYNTDARAPVTLTIWGSNDPNSILAGGATGTSSGATTITALKAEGWTEIIGVGSPSLANREAGVQITDTTGSLGQYRYLLFSHSPVNPGSNSSSYIREIDVYTGGVQSGGNVAITNHSFENGITGWTVSGGTSNFAETTGANTPFPEGIAARGFRDSNIADASPIVISQTLGLAKQGRYDLSFFVADRTVEDWLHYGVELLAGTNVIFSAVSTSNADLLPAGVTGTLAEGIQGDWHNVLLSGMVNGAWAGQTLTLRFFSANAKVDQPGGSIINDFALDNIQLSYVPAPAALPAGLGLLALSGFRGRGRRRLTR